MTITLRGTSGARFMGRLPLVALALGIAAPFAGSLHAQTTLKPAVAADSEVRLRKVEAEVRALQRKVFPDAAGKTFTPEITAGQTVNTPAGSPAAPVVTDLMARMDAVEAQLTRLTAQVEEGQNRAARMEERLAKLEADATPPAAPVVAQPAPSTTVVTPTKPATATPVTPKPATTTAKPASPSAARVAAVQAIEKPASGDAGLDEYNYGFRLWEAKFYPEAQQQLQIFVDRYPQHKMISHGRNLLGRAWMDDGKPGTAAQFFLQNYLADKKGARASDSLLYLGTAMVKLKDTEKACGAFAELSATYPDEVAGRLKAQYDAARATVKCK